MSVSLRTPLPYERGRSQRRAETSDQQDSPAARTRLPAAFTSGRFGIGVVLILLAGLVALLAVNTSLAAGSMQLAALEGSLARAQEKEEALAIEVEERSSPEDLQAAAIRLGMVPAPAPAFVDPATGALTGSLAPAGPSPRRGVVAPQLTYPTVPATPSPSPLPAATPAPTPQPTSGPDEGVDGALLPPHETVTPPASAPTPAAALPLPAGDGAALVIGEGD